MHQYALYHSLSRRCTWQWEKRLNKKTFFTFRSNDMDFIHFARCFHKAEKTSRNGKEPKSISRVHQVRLRTSMRHYISFLASIKIVAIARFIFYINLVDNEIIC